MVTRRVSEGPNFSENGGFMSLAYASGYLFQQPARLAPKRLICFDVPHNVKTQIGYTALGTKSVDVQKLVRAQQHVNEILE